MKKNNKRISSRVKNLSLLVFSSLICFISAEFFARYTLKFKADEMLNYEHLDEKGTTIGFKSKSFRHIKGSGDYDVEVRFNKYGFRDKKLISDSKENSWMVVGDSFTFGHGVEEYERFSNKIEEFFEIDTYNLGIPNDLMGYKNIIKYAKDIGSKSRKVIVAICMENDLILKDKNSTKNSYVRSKIPYLPKLKDWLHRNLALYQFVARISTIESPFTDYLKKIGVVEKVIPNRVSKPNDYSVHKTTKSIREFKNYSDELVVVLIPSRYLWSGSILI
jgi:hypothetical protein